MEYPDLDELEWLESKQEEEEYLLELQGEVNNEDKDEHFKYSYEGEEEEEAPVPSPERKRRRSIDENDIVRVRAKVKARVITENLSRYASDIDGDCIPVTAPGPCGERVYAKLDQRNTFNLPPNSSGTATSNALISQPIPLLLQQAEQDALLKALQATSQVQTPFLSSVSTQQLWVNKYAPRSFTELLSDEQTNREVLSWLKQWDAKVFGNDIKNTGDEVLSALRWHCSLSLRQKHSTTSLLGKYIGPKSAVKNMENSFTLESEKTRPKGDISLQNKTQNGLGARDQVLLLCGPPGLGKTTLAHVAAKHCGYHVVEINASDDRSSSSIESKVLDAVQMNSVMGHSKPKCLVIDEIDGALGDGKGAIEVILRMVAAEKKSYAGNETSATTEHFGRKPLKKANKPASLSRPIICICNDLYAPSLRPLRSVAKVHVFAQPTVNRVVSRLKYICSREEMKISSIALTALAEYTECDIRSCLHTLQFLHKKKESLNLVALSSQVIGRKDITRSIFDVWKEVFQKRKMKQSRKNDDSPKNIHDVHGSLYSMISSRVDHELIYDGIHENFCKLHYHDPLLQKTVHCLNALGVSDLLHQCVTHSHNMSLLVYHPSIIITIHQLFARVESPTIEWPKSFSRCRSLLTGKMERLRSWQSKISPCISRHLSINSFVEDTVSPLLHILSPSYLKPVAVHLLSEKEKNDLAQLISIMVSYSLTYMNSKPDLLSTTSACDGINDSSSLSLDPPIQGFVNFKGCKPGHCQLTSAVKQVLMCEVEKQKIVQESQAKCTHSTDRNQDIDAATDKANGTTNACEKFNKDEEKTLQKKIYKPNDHRCPILQFDGISADLMKLKSTGDIKKTSIGSFNFFDRYKKSSAKGCYNADSSKEKLVGTERHGHHLLFKFNEGFTNAVKRPVRIREFLL